VTTTTAAVRCTHAPSCTLFPRLTLASSLRIWQLHYCERDYTGCERFKLALGRQPVPELLLPNGRHLQLAPGSGRGTAP